MFYVSFQFYLDFSLSFVHYIYIAIIYKIKSEIYVLSVRSIDPLINIQFVQMAQSQRVSQYMSDAESDFFNTFQVNG